MLPAASSIETVLVFIALSSRRGHWNYLHIGREEKLPLFSLLHSGWICPGQRILHVVIRNHVHIKRWSLDPTWFSSCSSIVRQSLWFRRQERSILDGILTSLWRFPRRWSSTSWFSGHGIEHLTSKSELAFNHFSTIISNYLRTRWQIQHKIIVFNLMWYQRLGNFTVHQLH